MEPKINRYISIPKTCRAQRHENGEGYTIYDKDGEIYVDAETFRNNWKLAVQGVNYERHAIR